MALYLIATPLGNPMDIGLRSLEKLKSVATIILEERKEGTQFLRAHGITGKNYAQLNEHTDATELAELTQLCQKEDVALITDCGTPGFCDPGAHLVRSCRQAGIPVHSYPGPSSLMLILSLSSVRLDQFLFRGFISAETSQREQDWLQLTKYKEAIVMMDTPYRLQKTLDDLEKWMPQRRVLLGLSLTQETEQIFEGRVKDFRPRIQDKKAEFILLIYPLGSTS